MKIKEKLKKNMVWVVLAFIILLLGIWLGYIADCECKKSLDIIKVLNNSDEYLNIHSFISMFVAIGNGGYATKGFLYSACGSGVLLMWFFLKADKRFHRKGVEHGSAHWGGQEEKDIIADTTKNGFYNNVIAASDVFLVLDRKLRDRNENNQQKTKKQTVNQVDEDQPLSISDVAKLKQKVEKIRPMLNLNMIILGGAGTGKSRFFVKPNLMQCNTSFVVTDPSGELLESCGKMLERQGYKIKVFNIDDMTHSCNYNPFHYLQDLNSDDEYSYDENAVIKMINVFMLNTKQEGASSGDQFWDDATRLLLSAICFYILEKEPIENHNLSYVLDLIHLANVDENKKEVSDLDILFEAHREEYTESVPLSVQYYDEFKQAAGKTMQSILISTTTKLQHFKLHKVRDLTHTDNIHLETLGDELTALFIIIPSTDTTYNYLAAMMFTQLFDTLYRRAIYNGGRLNKHVQFILDEFANIGKIPDFDKVLATCRKFEISVKVILQNLSQLKRMYEKSWEELPGNCDTMIFLGGKDQFTNEYIMKSLGKETIDTVSINKTKSKQGSTSFNDGILGRELMQLNELETLDNLQCIVSVRGLPPFLTEKFDITNHPRYRMIGKEHGSSEDSVYLISSVRTEVEDHIFSAFSDSYIGDGIIEEIDIQVVDNTGVPYLSSDMIAEQLGISEEYKKYKELTGGNNNEKNNEAA